MAIGVSCPALGSTLQNTALLISRPNFAEQPLTPIKYTKMTNRLHPMSLCLAPQAAVPQAAGVGNLSCQACSIICLAQTPCSSTPKQQVPHHATPCPQAVPEPCITAAQQHTNTPCPPSHPPHLHPGPPHPPPRNPSPSLFILTPPASSGAQVPAAGPEGIQSSRVIRGAEAGAHQPRARHAAQGVPPIHQLHAQRTAAGKGLATDAAGQG